MNYALDALMLIRLDAHRGVWVDAKDLASHYSLTAACVNETLEGLFKRGQIRVRRDRADGPVTLAMTFPETAA